MTKKIPVYSWEQIPDNKKVISNPDWWYIVMQELKGGGTRNYTYKLEGKNAYVGRWYR